MLDELGDVAAPVAATAMPNALRGIDREAVIAAAFWAWPRALVAITVKLNATPPDLSFNPDCAGPLDPTLMLGGAHAAPPRTTRSLCQPVLRSLLRSKI